MDLDKLEEFLINNSDINKEFIRDFFGVQKTKKYIKDKPFTINLEDVAHWLETTKKKLKETLVNSYSEIKDYIVRPDNGPNYATLGGPKKKIVLITPKCFKKLCMLSRTEKAELVRDYYIQLEELVNDYKDIIIEAKQKEINILKNDLKKNKYPIGGHVYIFEESDELGKVYYRIGLSKDLNKRFAVHNSSSFHNKKLIFTIKTSNIYHMEKCKCR